jgi:hypothetical protein
MGTDPVSVSPTGNVWLIELGGVPSNIAQERFGPRLWIARIR